jgi:hypothetical protein
MEAVICVVMTLSSFDVLRVLSGAAYSRGFEADRLQALARIYIGAHADGYNVAEIFLGLGSTVFACLWLKSRYIPRALAVWDVFSSVLVAIATLTFVICPHFTDIADPGCYVPIATFELTMGLWLLIKGLRLFQSINYIQIRKNTFIAVGIGSAVGRQDCNSGRNIGCVGRQERKPEPPFS